MKNPKTFVGLYLGLFDKVVQAYYCSSPLTRNTVFGIGLLLVPFYHLLFPLWIFILLLPWIITYYAYYFYAKSSNGITFDRVYLVTIAVVNHLVFFLQKNTRETLYYHCKELWNQKRPRVHRDVDFGSKKGSKLDIYVRDASKPPSAKESYPVIIFFYGGGWSGGDKSLYAPLGLKYSTIGYIVVIPDYCKYPNSAESILEDVATAMEWTLGNIHNFGGDPQCTTVVGHSAGAHLSSLAIISHCTRMCDVSESFSEDEESYGLEDIYGVVLLAGAYDIGSHYLHESKRGVEELSCLERLFGPLQYFPNWSPTKLLQSLDEDHIESGKWQSLIPSHWLIIHSIDDKTAPFTPAFEFFRELQNTDLDGAIMKSIRGGHADIIFDMMLPESKTCDIATELQDFHARAIRLDRYKEYVLERVEHGYDYISFEEFAEKMNSMFKGPCPAR